MILFMMTFLFIYASYRYYKDIGELSSHLEEREIYISMIEDDLEWYEKKVDLCDSCEDNKMGGGKAE